MFRELVLEVFSDRFGFLQLYFFIPLLHSGTDSGWDVSYGIMAEMLLRDLLILFLIYLIFTV